MQDPRTPDIVAPQQTPPLPFTLRQLECFLAVAQSGSIARAALALRASDSAVSDAISAMERSLGAELFRRRRSRGATLTSDGLAILPLARRIVTDSAELTAAVGRDLSSIVGPVRIGCIGTLASLILPRLLIIAQQNYPGIHLEHRTGDLPTLLSAAASADLDLIITFDIDVPPEYERVTLASTEAMLVLPADHPLARRERVALAEVADEPMVLLDITASRSHTLELMSSHGITPRIAHRTPDYELCRALVGRGLGYTLLLRRDIPPETWDGRSVVCLPITPAPRPVDVLVAWPQNPIPPRVAAVVDCAKRLRPEIDMRVDAGTASR